MLNAKAGELAPKSINHLRAHVHRIFELAIRRGLFTGPNPAKTVPRIKQPKRLPQYLKAEEVPLMLTALERRWWSLFATAVYTGMGKGELLALRKSDVGLKTGTLRVGRPHASDTTKGNREDLLPIAVGLVPYLREAMAMSHRGAAVPEVYGHLEVEDMRKGLNQLDFHAPHGAATE
jgi:integrase